jgi:hypothetical protein
MTHSKEEEELQSLLIDNIRNHHNTREHWQRGGDIEQTRDKQNAPQTSRRQTMSRKRNRVGCWIVAILLILVAIGAGVSIHYYNEKRNAEKEEKMYAVLSEDNYNQRDYEDFIREFPESKYLEDVKKRLEELEILYADWEEVKGTHNVEELKVFCNKYNAPTCEFYHNALERIDQLDWKSARKEHTIEGYDRYMREHPEGNWALEAATEKDRLQKEEEERRRQEEDSLRNIEKQDADTYINSDNDTTEVEEDSENSILREVREVRELINIFQ